VDQRGSCRSAAELLGIQELPKEGRDRLVVNAIELFYRHGFQAVGLDMILHHAGVSKTTFYKHFDSKDDLIVAAIRMRDQWETGAWQRAVRRLAGDDPRRQLLAMFEVMDVWFNDPEFQGCIFLSAATEYPNPHDPIHQAAIAHRERNHANIARLAEAAGADDPQAFADQYTVLFEGALIMRQLYHRNDAARLARDAVQLLMDRMLPPVQSTPAGVPNRA